MEERIFEIDPEGYAILTARARDRVMCKRKILRKGTWGGGGKFRVGLVSS